MVSGPAERRGDPRLEHRPHQQPVTIPLDEQLQPNLRRHNACVELLGVEDGTARLRLHAAVGPGSGSARAARTAVEDAVADAAPEIQHLEIEERGQPAVTPVESLFRPPGKARGVRMSAPAGFAALRRPATQPVEPAPPSPQPCELCSEPVAAEHRHLLDRSARELRCACRASVLLFDRKAAGGGHYRLVPDRRWLLRLRAGRPRLGAAAHPIQMAFLFHDSRAGRVVFYPSPGGTVGSLLELEAWNGMVMRSPVLGQLEPDVEALLVNRARGRP